MSIVCGPICLQLEASANCHLLFQPQTELPYLPLAPFRTPDYLAESSRGTDIDRALREVIPEELIRAHNLGGELATVAGWFRALAEGRVTESSRSTTRAIGGIKNLTSALRAQSNFVGAVNVSRYLLWRILDLYNPRGSATQLPESVLALFEQLSLSLERGGLGMEPLRRFLLHPKMAEYPAGKVIGLIVKRESIEAYVELLVILQYHEKSPIEERPPLEPLIKGIDRLRTHLIEESKLNAEDRLTLDIELLRILTGYSGIEQVEATRNLRQSVEAALRSM